MEIALHAGAGAAEDLLRARGFAPCGAGRFGANLAQHEKVQLVTRVLGELGNDLADLSVLPVDEIYGAARPDEPRPEVVA